jgi:hypothetical protein
MRVFQTRESGPYVGFHAPAATSVQAATLSAAKLTIKAKGVSTVRENTL